MEKLFKLCDVMNHYMLQKWFHSKVLDLSREQKSNDSICCEKKLNQIDYFLSLNNQPQNLTSIDLTLTWSLLKFDRTMAWITILVCTLQSMSKTTHKACVTRILCNTWSYNVICWPDLTLTLNFALHLKHCTLFLKPADAFWVNNAS